jgi:hypothetical protein
MPDEPDKPGGDTEAGGSADDVENERPTVSPPFDPIAFARDILRPSPPPMPRIPLGIDPHTKITPPHGVAQRAVEASRPSSKPPPSEPRPSWDSGRRSKTPTSTLSLANARIPSNLPPRADPGPKRTESFSELNAVDREWAELERATRPPPADGPGEDPVVEIAHDRTPNLDLDDVDLEEPPSSLELGRSDSPPFGAGLVDELEEHGAETVRRPILEEVIKPREREMADRVSLGDYSGALEIAEKILADSPNDENARACAENCRAVLRQMYATRIGPLDRVPVVMVPRDQLRWLSIDHKAGFVLSLVDGVSTLEMIIDVSGMAELDTLRILSELAQQRIISLR